MKIALIGGHGKVALLASPLLIEAGHSVTSFIRNPDHAADVAATGATPEVIDIERLDIEGWGEALAGGYDAVVWSAGAGGGSRERTWAVDFTAAKNSMVAALRAGIARYVMVSYSHASLTHTIPTSNGFWDYAEAKAEADVFLRGSGLHYTILGPSSLTLDEPTLRVSRVPNQDLPAEVPPTSRANVAHMIVEALEDPAAIDVTYRFTDGDTPISRAFES